MDVSTFRTEGLGDNSYLLTHDGVAVVVDPQRDIDRFLGPLDASGARLGYILETHLHNDYVSGGRQLRDVTGGELVLPAAAAAAYRHTPAFHLEDLDAGPFIIRPIHTPGHTPEHTSYLVIVDNEPVAVFSGGSLLVGSAGRPDLLGMERADTLARLQYGSVHRLASLPRDVDLLPTHGAGSFCTATAAASTTSTIGAEVDTNPVLAYADEATFVKGQLAGLVPYPSYYHHMGPANLLGYPPPPHDPIPELEPHQLDEMEGVVLVDARSKRDFAAGHIPGSIGVELADGFGVWVGWLVPFDARIVLVADNPSAAAEARTQLARIGMDSVAGVLFGIAGWKESGRPLRSYRTVDLDGFLAAMAAGEVTQVLDVRAPNEYEAATIEGAVCRYLPDLVAAIPDGFDNAAPVWVVCGTGYRATSAAAFLERAELAPVVLVDDGVPEVLAALA